MKRRKWRKGVAKKTLLTPYQKLTIRQVYTAYFRYFINFEINYLYLFSFHTSTLSACWVLWNALHQCSCCLRTISIISITLLKTNEEQFTNKITILNVSWIQWRIKKFGHHWLVERKTLPSKHSCVYPIIICLVLNCILPSYPAHVWPSNKRRTDICRIKYTNQPATLQIRPTSSTKIR